MKVEGQHLGKSEHEEEGGYSNWSSAGGAFKLEHVKLENQPPPRKKKGTYNKFFGGRGS
jgi:hypothetical protein